MNEATGEGPTDDPVLAHYGAALDALGVMEEAGENPVFDELSRHHFRLGTLHALCSIAGALAEGRTAREVEG